MIFHSLYVGLCLYISFKDIERQEIPLWSAVLWGFFCVFFALTDPLAQLQNIPLALGVVFGLLGYAYMTSKKLIAPFDLLGIVGVSLFIEPSSLPLFLILLGMISFCVFAVLQQSKLPFLPFLLGISYCFYLF